MQENPQVNSQEAVNFDEELLVAQRVDTSYNEPILHQVLRIAVYDEYHAYETYKKIIETFGNIVPFSNIIESEIRHFNALEPLLIKYNVPAPINNWAEKIEIPNTLLECCEVGVVAEIDNIKMYDDLLSYVNEYPDIQDVLYQLQAASYNNHLPAFRSCVQKYSASEVDINSIYEQPSMQNNPLPSSEDMANKMNEFNELAGKLASGQLSQEELLKVLGNTNLSFVGGALLGAVGMSMFGQLAKSSNEAEIKE